MCQMSASFCPKSCKLHPNEPFASFLPQIPSVSGSELRKVRRAADFEVLKSRNVWSGKEFCVVAGQRGREEEKFANLG